ncbi:Putative uncharacterized protein [Taphrina deformans PYCC 5710]|uniref:Uncharacterized protein n=1 Tax=Taphrina deformans (strain PYCC 5710 / ATCC 11124 / CBS 356.35 / IMI 108563 / JCM 9778 / NBRC 8474) TaxID=1097556 RepID=R4X6R6_TAPDE|nr:Putative uncharacterized protein [Taphrina deformans PYCC 5710]|eukprot:CCG80611.1 Putative uncharacterized protein [Taphrina deformans PYCC 5710]
MKAARHISFGIVTTSEIKTELTTPQFVSDADPEKDYSGEATPTVKRSFQVPPVATCRQSVERKVSNQSCHSDNVSTDEGNTFFTRPRAIRFGNSTTPSVDSSRRSSFNEISHGAVTDESTRCRSLHAGTNNSPPGIARSGLATCKSTLEAVLKKEAIAKVIETVPEDDEEDDEEDREEEDFDHEDDEEQDEEEEDEDADDFDDGQSFLELGSDDDGYQEDIESDDDLLDDDVYPPVLAESGTPKMSLSGRNGLQAKDSQAVSPRLNYTQVHRTAAPSESDLPDTTDFAPGNMDEDQAACIAFDVAIKDRKARRQPAKPSDIDPTFPQSGSDNDSDIEALQESPELNKNIKNICRSPTLQRKTTDRQRWHSPPLAKMVDLCRAKSLPRRYLTGRKGLYEPKPPRAVTIKQSNEQRAQRRREKTELRHNLRRNKQVIDHNGHEKMKVHCLSRKKLVATENPCVIRPIMSI